MNLRWRVLTRSEVSSRRREGKKYFEFTDSWRQQCELPTAAVLESLDGPTGNWLEIPFHEP